jgi:hypothetical protein
MSLFRKLSRSMAIAGFVVWASWASAQDAAKSKDDVLDSLLEKLDSPPDQGSGLPAKTRPRVSSDGTNQQPPAVIGPDGRPIGRPSHVGKTEAPVAAGDVAPKDKALDNLLEKLGETQETPAPDDRPKGPHGGSGRPEPPRQGEAKKDDLKKPEKDLDRHLEELTGRKPKGQGQDDDEEGSGPLSEVIKEMRDVEKRLAKNQPDTGKETRRKQTEIVKRLNTLIEQLRNASSSSQGRRRVLVMRPVKPDSKPGDGQGAQAGSAPLVRPKTPTATKSHAGGKSEWGHLPPELRQELENVFKEEELPGKTDLIRRYFLSLDKKYLLRRE